MTATVVATTEGSTLDRQISMTRVFNAPRALVFEATSNCKHIRNWWGCDEYPMTGCEIDFRVGGSYRFVTAGPDGMEFPMTGVYQEIVPLERVVCTQVFDVPPFNERAALVVLTFTEENGKTTMVDTIIFPTVEDFQGAASMGMESGMAQALDRLAEVVDGLAEGASA